MRSRKIKSLSVRPCEHEYDVSISIRQFKMVGEMAVIQSIDPMVSTCSVCGYVLDEMVCGGVVYLTKEAE